jgi:hypothetical protein
MTGPQRARRLAGVYRTLNRTCAAAMVALSVIALGTILWGAILRPEPPQTDEGTLAHIFQLAIGLLVPFGAAFIASIDWTRPRAAAPPLAVTALLTAMSFALLYRFEHP